eukprot:gene57762-biopygen59097
MGVVLVGDFGQAPPIGEMSLLAPPTAGERRAGARQMGCLGRRLFNNFDSCYRLRRVHRQGAVCDFKDSTLRLRDGAMSMADYRLWQTHDINSHQASGELKKAAEDFMWLCAENAAAGQRNGRRAGLLARESKKPVIRVDAEHNESEASKRPADEFRQLRTRVHLVEGAPVMLTVNIIWEMRTVRLGLMNGARGHGWEVSSEGIDP